MARVSMTELEREILRQVRSGIYTELNGEYNCAVCGELQGWLFKPSNPGHGTHEEDCYTVLLRNQQED